MDFDTEEAIYRIIAGYYYININNITYKVILPNLNIKRLANNIYKSIIDENKYDTSSWISDKAINNLLKVYDIWNDVKETEFQSLLENLNKVKIQLYLNYTNSSIKSQLKQTIESINKNINIEYSKKHYFDYLTLEHYAESIKSQFLIANTIFDKDNNQVFDFENFNDIDTRFLNKILFQIQQHTLNLDEIKKIARSELWKSFWTVSKTDIFDGKIKDWTDEQRSLVSFSKLLDNVREHFESPSEEIISDDDALDGWILYQSEKSEKEKKQKQISDKYGLDKKEANEVFIITNDKDEQKTIFNLNDEQTKRDLRKANKLVDEKGTVKETELPHVKRELQNKFKEMTRERMKNS